MESFSVSVLEIDFVQDEILDGVTGDTHVIGLQEGDRPGVFLRVFSAHTWFVMRKVWNHKPFPLLPYGRGVTPRSYHRALPCWVIG